MGFAAKSRGPWATKRVSPRPALPDYQVGPQILSQGSYDLGLFSSGANYAFVAGAGELP